MRKLCVTGLSMSLRRKLMLWIILLLMFLLAGNLIVSVVNSKSYYIKQMSALSEDTATSLGLTISHAVKAGDIVQVEAMVNVIFDRGYYLSITYNDLKGNVLVSRARKIAVEGVPDWFTHLVEIPSLSGSAEVASGWFRLGELHVVSHPGYAYQELWNSFISQLWLFLFAVVFAYGALGLSIRKMLSPLSLLETQANAVCREEFMLIERRPLSSEFSTLVDASNRMVNKIQLLFRGQVELTKILRQEAYIDSITGLPNRDEFDAQVSSYIESNRLCGGSALILCTLRELGMINVKYGREAGDEWLRSVAQSLESVLVSWPTAIVGRRNGADFGIFIPGLMAEDIDNVMSHLIMDIKCVSEALKSSKGIFHRPAQFGIALSSGGVRLSALLATADQAMRVAQSKDIFYDVQLSGDRLGSIRAANEWLPIIETTIEHKTLEFMFQKQFWRDSEEPSSLSLPIYEVFSRLRVNDELISAGIFWPLVERFRLEETLDRLVIERILGVLNQQKRICLSVNVSFVASSRPEFHDWLREYLSSFDRSITSRLTLEFPERVLCQSIAVFRHLVPILKSVGVSICVARFGLMPSSIGYLQELNVDSVKIDRRFIFDIYRHQANRFYVKILIQVAHSFSLKIYADGIEQLDDQVILREMGINGMQGYLLSEPQPLDSLPL